MCKSFIPHPGRMKYYYQITLVVLLIAAISFSSCQKELSIEGAKIPISGLLIKSVAVTASDSLVTVYTYDDIGQLETETTDGSIIRRTVSQL